MNQKLDQWLIKIQWFIILITGIFLLWNNRHQDIVVVLLWEFSIVCNAFWARGTKIANIEYTYLRVFRRYPKLWLVVRMMLIIIIEIFVIGYVI